jgi:CO/xanthine dehydrogenase Mo-binding subunit
MSIAAPEPKVNMGQPIPRYDAFAKVTGKAQYAADVPLPNPAYAYLVTSSIAKGRIDSFDLTVAKRVGGLIDIVTHENAEKLKDGKLFGNGGYASTTIQPLKSPEIAQDGQIIAVVLAETFEAAREAAHLVKVNYTAAVPTTTFDSRGTTSARAKGQLAQFKEDPEVGDFARAFDFGAEFVELRINRWTHEIRVPRMLGAFAAGHIMNPRTSRSQLMGGLIWGMSSALHEATELDERYARYVNDNLADCLMPVNAGVSSVDVIMLSEQDDQINPAGIKGLGELANVGTNAAICNAIYNATGQRIRKLPVRLESLEI